MLVSDCCYCIHQSETAIAPFKRVLDKAREALAIPQGIALIVVQEGRRVQADNAKIADNCDRTGEAAWQRLKLN
jgi:hypothetical protein